MNHKHTGIRSSPIEPLVCIHCSMIYDKLVEQWVDREEYDKRQEDIAEKRRVFGNALVAKNMNQEGL